MLPSNGDRSLAFFGADPNKERRVCGALIGLPSLRALWSFRLPGALLVRRVREQPAAPQERAREAVSQARARPAA